MQVSLQDQAKFLETTLRPEQQVMKNGNEMMQLTARQATLFIYRKEGLPGFMRGFVPSMMKSTLNAGSYFSMLYYCEEMLRRTGLFREP